MSSVNRPARWSDHTIRIIKRTVLLLGVLQIVGLYFRMDKYTVYVFLLYLFLVIAAVAFRLQMGKAENDDPAVK